MKIFALLVSIAGAGCAAAGPAVKPALVEVGFRSSTDIFDDGAQINGKLCFGETHWDRSALADGAIDLLAGKRHFVVSPVSATETRIVGDILFRGGASSGHRLSASAQPFAIGSQEDRRLALEASGPRGTRQDAAVDLRFGPDHLEGRIGWQQFSARTVGDHLEGEFRLNAMNPVGLKIYGVEQLWKLPLAEQGVLLPSLLNCVFKSGTHAFVIDLRGVRQKVG